MLLPLLLPLHHLLLAKMNTVKSFGFMGSCDVSLPGTVTVSLVSPCGCNAQNVKLFLLQADTSHLFAVFTMSEKKYKGTNLKEQVLLEEALQ